ncbi:hypothetical protein PWT90_10956 [Aphanocladium album]|nr:hypothetical protein PWT90_10956 [Aphanocladium album]
MKSTFSVAVPVMAAAGAFANAHSNLHHVRAPATVETALPKVNVPTLQGCFSTVANMTTQPVDEPQFLSSGKCTKACIANNFYVAAISPTTCYCGMVYPALKDGIDMSKCNYPCSGYDKENCGGLKDAYSVFNNGLIDGLAPDNYGDSTSSSSSTTTQSSTSATSTAATSTHSQVAETGKPEKSGGGGPNTAAIAAGVVVGVVVAAAIIGAIIFFIRRKRNAEIEEEHRRNAAVNAFISGSKPPSTSGGISITDSRLDPVMAHRRLSDGSIADNQDYSRKILRVTNA